MAQQQQQASGSEDGMAPVWITVLILLIGFFIWHYYSKYLVAAVFYINLQEARLIQLLIDNPILAGEIYYLQTANPAVVDWTTLVKHTETIGYFLRYPVIAILAVMSFFVFRSDIKTKFRKAHNMKTLRAQEQYNWPSIMPIIKEDLALTPIKEGPWAMALSPMEFARNHQLLKKNDALTENSTPGLELTASIRRGDAKRVFTLQLGQYWDGVERCQPHVQAIIAILAARINRDREGARKAIDALNRTFAQGKPEFKIALPLIKKHFNTELVLEKQQKHAYMLTFLATLLEEARKDGVIATAEFLWLKVIDRRLWYMLNCVGRQTPYVEIAGPFAHWKAEKKMKRAIMVPMIDEASKALEMAIKEVKLSERELKELKP